MSLNEEDLAHLMPRQNIHENLIKKSSKKSSVTRPLVIVKIAARTSGVHDYGAR